MYVKKVLAVLLTAVLLVSALVVPVGAVAEDSITVHYYNENNWSNPYIYYYDGGNQPVAWPGTAMANDGNGWFSYTITGMSQAKVIFSDNGANQYPAQNEPGLDVSGEKWYKQGVFFNYNPDTAKTVVHYYNASGWSNPYVYYYDGDNRPVAWPGAAMANEGNGCWFSYTVTGMSQAKVIFSDNGANQYPSQNQPGIDVSGEKWFANGNLYDSEPEAITVHFQNYDNWNNVNIYYYNGEREGTSWTGVPMNADGDGWYTYKIFEYNEARVLFNNGNGTQIPPAMEPGFLVSGEMWYRNGTWTTERPEEITVYFYKPEGWSAPNIYYYKNDSDTGPAWPGTAMQQVQDNWYAYTITKYSEAKVMFNSGAEQIPAQNQPGLDAKGIMWYKDGVWCDMETDTDNDSLPDYMELVFGSNMAKADTDNDGLPDGYEVYTLGTDPTKSDSDSNGKNDGAEDADNDGLTNLKEYQLGTDPTKDDSDNDGLKDGEEVNTYETDPLQKDTDGDTLSDGDDVALGFSPLLPDTDGNGILDCDEKLQQTLTQEINCEENPQVTDVTVSFEGSGNINSNTTITDIFGTDVFVSETVGLVGAPVEIESEAEFDEAVITFKVDKTKLGNTEFKNLGILWYDEENKLFRMQDVTLDEGQGTVSATVTHFSKYMVVDKKAWFDTWQHKIVYDSNTEEIQTVLAIDCSGSMAENDPGIYYYNHHETTTYRELAAEKYIDAMRSDGDMASIVVFTTSAKAVVHMTNDKETLYDGLSNISSYGGTSFFAAIETSLNEFDESCEASKAIILLTDGEASVSDTMLQKAVDKNVAIFVIGINCDSESTMLQHIADYTGGEFYVAKTASEIVDIYSNVQLNQHIDATDTDGDGLADIFETAGMRLPNGHIVYTNPLMWDTDGDGIKDGEEISVLGHQTIRYTLNDDGTFTEELTNGYQFFMISDPSKVDSDGDGLNDPLDNEPLNPKVHSFLIYETVNSDTDLKALDFDERPEDYKYADESFFDLLGKFPINLDDVISTEQRHINNFIGLMVLGSYQDSDMQSVALDMAERFLNGSGEDYRNDILTQKVQNHEATQYYVNSVSSMFEDLIKSENGNIASAAYTKNKILRQDCYMVKTMKNAGLDEPYFGDYFSGLGICIHSLYGNKFEVTSYEFDGNHYKYTLHFTMYDVFGLNSSDITEGYSYNDSYSYPYGLIPNFRSWYVLQHYNIYNGKYKPFISYIEFDMTFEGSII